MILAGREREREIEIENKKMYVYVRERGLCATAAYISFWLFFVSSSTKKNI